jgi:voltage-gated potassium channel
MPQPDTSAAPTPVVRPARRLGPLASGFAAILLLTALGTAGFGALEQLPFGDAVYLTVTTLSTVGYGDVVPVTAAGRWLAVGLIVAGVGAVFYTAVALAEFLIEGRLRDVLGRRAVKRSIDSLDDHVIVCGYGRLGRAVVERLREAGVASVVIESDPAAQLRCEAEGNLLVPGSALDDGALLAAGIRRARALVAATSSDPDNVFLTLSAREHNPNVLVHARAQTEAGTHRMRLAGAHQVISPYQLGGQRIANAILRPAVVEFLELSSPGRGGEVDLEEVVLPEGSPVHDVALRDLSGLGIQVSVVAIKRGDDPIRVKPGPDDVLRAGDHVIVVGDRPNLERLTALAGG